MRAIVGVGSAMIAVMELAFLVPLIMLIVAVTGVTLLALWASRWDTAENRAEAAKPDPVTGVSADDWFHGIR